MPHADSSSIPEVVKSKIEFWEHVHLQLVGLLDNQTSWVIPPLPRRILERTILTSSGY